MPDLPTDFALVAAVFTVTALVSGLVKRVTLYLNGDVPWTEKRVSPTGEATHSSWGHISVRKVRKLLFSALLRFAYSALH